MTKDWDIKIMSFVMMVVVAIAIIAATVAWFTFSSYAAVTDLSLTTAQSDTLLVELKNGVDENGYRFVKADSLNEDSVYVDMDMPLFDNVEQYTIGEDEEAKDVSKLAPGVSGTITIRLTPLKESINGYKITGKSIFNYIEDSSEDEEELESNSSVNKMEIDYLSLGHIMLFAERKEIPEGDNPRVDDKKITEYVHDRKYVYDKQLTMDEETAITGALSWDSDNEEGIAQELTIYWYWPYEYDNLSENLQKELVLEGYDSKSDDEKAMCQELYKNYYDPDKLQERLSGNSVRWTEQQLYDYADTLIGTYVKSIQLYLEVEGFNE